MANYSPQDIATALEQGLITEQDAEYLRRGIEPEGSFGVGAGAMLGAGLGSVAGSGLGRPAGRLAGGKLGKSARAVAGGVSFGGLLGGAGGTALGGAAGAEGMRALSPPEGEGVTGEGAYNPNTGALSLDRDRALAMLVDPNTPPELKRKIMDSLQAADAANPPGEAGVGDTAPIGAGILGTLGAATGGIGGGMRASSMGAGRVGKAAGALGGALASGAANAYVGEKMFPSYDSPYADPLSEEL